MYDQLWNESPTAQKKMAESKIEGAQRILVNIVKARFPGLADLAQQEVTRIDSLDNLDLLAQKVATAPDEAMVRFLLTPSAV